MTTQQKYYAGIAIGVVIAILTGITKADPAALNLSPVVVNWIGIVLGGLGVLALSLNAVTKGPDPLANGEGTMGVRDVAVQQSNNTGKVAFVFIVLLFVVCVVVGQVYYSTHHVAVFLPSGTPLVLLV